MSHFKSLSKYLSLSLGELGSQAQRKWFQATPLMFIPFVFLALVMIFSPCQAYDAGDQGFGVMAGNPTGFSGKVWLDSVYAIDGAVGVDRGEFDVHASLLYHDENFLKTFALFKPWARLRIPAYIGVGPRILFEDKKEVGVRFPVGISYFPDKTYLEIFGELAPVFRLTPSVGFNGDFAVGVRYYFEAIRSKEAK